MSVGVPFLRAKTSMTCSVLECQSAFRSCVQKHPRPAQHLFLAQGICRAGRGQTCVLLSSCFEDDYLPATSSKTNVPQWIPAYEAYVLLGKIYDTRESRSICLEICFDLAYQFDRLNLTLVRVHFLLHFWATIFFKFSQQ